MRNNFARSDLEAVVDLLRQDDPVLTQSSQVRAFEREWSQWLGVEHSVFVNSGSSANLLTMAALRATAGPGEVIVPTLTWVSDIAAVLQSGFEPVFVDIDPRTLGMDNDEVIRKLSPHTKAVFLTHVLGYSGLSLQLLDELTRRRIPLIEDCCESHGATFHGFKLGTLGLMSNFSFYYAHHLTTIEGGMISTNDDRLYQVLRMLRSHGMVREATDDELRAAYHADYPDLNPEFIFAYPAYNVRSTEVSAVIGRNQLKRLDDNIAARRDNLALFLDHLDGRKYQTDFAVDGCSSYALTLVLKQADAQLADRLAQELKRAGVEFRRGMSGGGNQLRQPYLRNHLKRDLWQEYPKVEHVHFYGFYIGNYPELPREKILALCELLNGL
ncbi:MAG TPA: aminotransferase class I/II-fold pyridoxal phosphate-dependent enzyme [Pirellulales bacterium]|nr:aminotransferase class I/II-fold pyridoxal phosphate-dependent enzyme [Pirellulales bacterium]